MNRAGNSAGRTWGPRSRDSIRQAAMTLRGAGTCPWMFAALLIVVCGGAFAEDPPDAAASGPGAALQVDLHDGLLTLSASRAPLPDVIREIGNAAGFDTLVYGDLRREVTRSMTDVPLGEALGELLQDVSHVIESDQSAVLARVRLYATSAAGDAPDAIYPEAPGRAIVTTTLDPRTASRITAIRDQAAGGDLEAREDLVRLMREDEDPAVRSRAALALSSIGDPAVVSALRTGVGDSEQIVRLRAIRALAALKNDPSTRVLADVLFGNPDARARLLAIWALQQHDSPLARSYLESARADGNTLVRQAAVRTRPEDDPAKTAGDEPAAAAETGEGGAINTSADLAEPGARGKPSGGETLVQ